MPNDISNKAIIEKSFWFSAALEDYHKLFQRLKTNFDDTFLALDKLRDAKLLEDNFLKDANKINIEFQKERIKKEDTKYLYDRLYKSLEQIREIPKITDALLRFMSQLNSREGGNPKGNSVNIDEVIHKILKEINAVRNSLPKADFGILEINNSSTMRDDEKTIQEFLNDHLNGGLAIPSIKADLKKELSNEKYDIVITEMNKNILFAFKTKESKEQKA